MLPPDARTILTDSLRPPPGSVLDYGVATTFTLDLASALVVPLAFAAHQLRDSGDPIAVMEAVRASSERLDIFCQAGNIASPGTDSTLLAFLEKIVQPVRRPRPGRLFHPKLWLLRYLDDGGEPTIRLLVLSRNLTADRSWDTCVRLDGTIGTRPRASNRPLFELLRALPGSCVNDLPADRAARLEHLADYVRYVEWEYPQDVLDIRFHALGVPGARIPDLSGSRHLVVSPFCTENGLTVSAPSRDVTLVSRQEELDLLPEQALDGFDIHVVNELASIPPDGEEVPRSILTGLHAKAYVVERGQRARIFLGSANATDAAFNGNVELLVEFEGTKWKLGIDTFVGEGTGFRSILEPYARREPAPDDDAVGRALEDVLRDLASVPLTATIEPVEPPHSLRLTSAGIVTAHDDVRLSAALLTRPGEARDLPAGRPADALYGGLAAVDITPFVVLRAESGGQQRTTVARAALVNDPEDRLDEIVAQQMDTPEKFLKFVALMLGLIDESTLLSAAGKGSGAWAAGAGHGVFELLLRSLVDRQDALADLARLVDRLRSTDSGRAVLPEGFEELWDAVDAVRNEPLA